MSVQKSPIVEALEKRRGKVHAFPASFIGDGSSNGTVAIRVPAIGDELRARIQAPIWLEQHGAVEYSAATDVESMFVVCAAWRDPANPANGIACPVPDMMRGLTADDVAFLVRCVDEVRRRESPFRESLTELEAAEYVEAVGACDDDYAHELMMGLDRRALEDLAVMACRQLAAFTGEAVTP